MVGLVQSVEDPIEQKRGCSLKREFLCQMLFNLGQQFFLPSGLNHITGPLPLRPSDPDPRACSWPGADPQEPLCHHNHTGRSLQSPLLYPRLHISCAPSVLCLEPPEEAALHPPHNPTDVGD